MIAGLIMVATDDTHATTVDSGSGRVKLGLSGMSQVADAPSDGTIYGRQNGSWTSASQANRTLEEFTPTTGQTVFALSQTPSGAVECFINGVRARSGYDFSISGTSLTWLDTDFSLGASDVMNCWYYSSSVALDYVTVSGVTVTVSGVAVWV
jgi:hypothetical protein